MPAPAAQSGKGLSLTLANKRPSSKARLIMTATPRSLAVGNTRVSAPRVTTE
jgi:hypothetical protein